MSDTDPNAPASSGQTWAIRCAIGLDVREVGLTHSEASDILDLIEFNTEEIIAKLQARGAKGKPKLPKAARERQYNNLLSEAWAKGMDAGAKHKPTPMIVQERANPLDESSPVTREYAPVAAGVCGFASVIVRPGNTSFARWLVASGHARRHYYGGVAIRVGEYGQSYEKKMAHAKAVAEHLCQHGIKAHPEGRLD